MSSLATSLVERHSFHLDWSAAGAEGGTRPIVRVGVGLRPAPLKSPGTEGQRG